MSTSETSACSSAISEFPEITQDIPCIVTSFISGFSASPYGSPISDLYIADVSGLAIIPESSHTQPGNNTFRRRFGGASPTD